MSLTLVARDVRLSYGRVTALDGVSVDIAAGCAVALVGESGSGKSTLLRCFNRMVEPSSGVVLVGDADVRSTDPIALRRRLGYVQQHGGLLPHWTVTQNVGLVLRAQHAVRRDEQARAVSLALSLVGLDEATFGARFPHELSGGQRQRVALARALAAKPGALLLDEPFGALDAISRRDVQDAFEHARRALGISVVLVTHDLGEAARLADRIIVMRAGRVEQEGTMRALRSSPATPYVAALVERAIAQADALAGA